VGEEASDLDAALNVGMKGQVEFFGVPPGRYMLHAMQIPRTPETALGGRGGTGALGLLPTEPTLWASVPVSVETENVTGLKVMLREAPRVQGRVEFEGSAARPTATQLTQIALTLEPAMPASRTNQPGRGRVDATATFATTGVVPGKYIIRMTGPTSPWRLKSIAVGTRDVTDLPIDIDSDFSDVVITMTDRPIARLYGTVRTMQGGGDPTASVIAFPTDKRYWTEFGSGGRRLQSVGVSKTGAYDLSGLPAGEYFVIAVRDAVATEWQDPELMESFARSAARVQIADGDRRVLDLRVTPR
jgi:hypothetical protein